MELRHLKYFVTVAEEKSFTKAAQRLFTAQPSLSQQIKDLEEEVGVLLFDRSSRKIQLTAEGQAFLGHALDALNSAKLAIAAARQVAHNKNNQIHMSFLNVAELKVMPMLINKLKQEIPNIQIHIQSLTCLEQIQRLQKAELDLCFTRYALQHPDYQNTHLLTEPIYLVASKKIHPSAEAISRQSLQQKTLIMCEQNSSPVFYEIINQQMGLDNIPSHQIVWVTNVLQHLNLINMGFGYSFLPEYALKFLNEDIQIVPTHFELPPLHLYANYRKDSQNHALSIIVQELEKIGIVS